jgi:hypothetical protein
LFWYAAAVAPLLTWPAVLDRFPGWECNSPIWRVVDDPDGGRCIAAVGNTVEDHEHGKLLLLGDPGWRDYALEAEIRVTRGYLANPRQTYPGVVLRARDVYNAECFFFRPHAEGLVGAAYVPIAHGLQPVWTEAYHDQRFGRCSVPFDAWFRVRAEVRGREARLFVDGAEAMRRTLTYYLWNGRPGLYVGTCTDALFRAVTVTAL